MEPSRTIEVGDYVEIQLEKDGPKIYEAKVLKKAASQRQTRYGSVYTTDITAKDRKGKIHTTDSYALHGRLRRVGRKYHRKRERIAVVLIFGLSVKSSSLCRLNDMGYSNAIGLLRRVLVASDERYLRESFQLGGPDFYQSMFPQGHLSYKNKHSYANPSSWAGPGYADVGMSTFPRFKGININMMPFILNDLTTLPTKFRTYDNMIKKCMGLVTNHRKDKNCVAYLTITETKVEKGKTQRRPGLHVEKPHSIPIKINMFDSMFGGSFMDGGIFMASNLDSTCRIWNAQVESHAIGWEGDVEYLRDHLDDVCRQNTSHTPRCRATKSRILTKANHVYWITDKTPHEAVPLSSSRKRQFFRLVVGPLSTWLVFECEARELPVIKLKSQAYHSYRLFIL